jgi:hypothetical protein
VSLFHRHQWQEVARRFVPPRLDAGHQEFDARGEIYGIPAASWSGASGELDHRQPFFAGGTTDPANVWPERGPATGNPKDALENYARRRLCTGRPHPMSLRTVHIIFAGNWVAYYRFYVLGVGPRPAS